MLEERAESGGIGVIGDMSIDVGRSGTGMGGRGRLRGSGVTAEARGDDG